MSFDVETELAVERWSSLDVEDGPPTLSQLHDDGRGRVGRRDERGAYSALVSARHRRPSTLRPLSAGGQRRRRDHGLPAAVPLRAHVGVRRRRQLGRGAPLGGGAGRVRLTLAHTSHHSAHWDEFGPGATGVGWELGLMELAVHVAQPDEAQMDEAAFVASPEGKAIIIGSSEAWGRAAIAPERTPRPLGRRRSAPARSTLAKRPRLVPGFPPAPRPAAHRPSSRASPAGGPTRSPRPSRRD